MPATTHNLFALEGKALDAPVKTERGDLILSGYAAVWDGLDFQNENFLRGAFREAIPEFLKRAGHVGVASRRKQGPRPGAGA